MRWAVLFVILLLIPFASALESEFTFQKSDNVTLPITCFDGITGQLCDTTQYSCFVTVAYPNSTLILNNESTYVDNNVYAINLSGSNLTSVSGFYHYTPFCSNGTDGGIPEEQLYYLVTPSGVEFSQTKTDAVTRSIWVIFSIGLLLLLGGFFIGSHPVKWSVWIFGAIAVLVTINLVFVSLQDEVVNPRVETLFDFITAASWYLYWFAGGLVMIIWMLTILNVVFRQRTERAIRKYGIG